MGGAQALSVCVGPYAFPKGNFKFLSGAAVRWVVRSWRFERDVRHAARLFGGGVQVPPPPSMRALTIRLMRGSLGRGAVLSLDGCCISLITHPLTQAAGSERWIEQARHQAHEAQFLSEDAQMGYWLSAHPSLRYVHLRNFHAWFEAWHHVSDRLEAFLAVHKAPYHMYARLLDATERTWQNATRVHVHSSCPAHTDRRVCNAGMCAHAPGQRVCSLYVTLPDGAGALSPKPRTRAPWPGGGPTTCRYSRATPA